MFGSSWAKSDPNNSEYLIDFSVRMGNGRDASSAYDENGNILAIKQWGLKLQKSELIDDLSYTYKVGNNVYTNKLLKVVDAKNETSTTLGDFRSSQVYMQNLPNGGKDAAIDYTYDKNGKAHQDCHLYQRIRL